MIIQNIRTILQKYHIGSLIAISFLFFSCSKDAMIEKQSSDTNSLIKMRTPNYSEIEIFKGIFFAEGPVADLIPELSEFKISNFISDSILLQEISDLHDDVLILFEVNNPGYMEIFRDVVLSSNHIEIENSLLEAADLLNNTLSEYYHDAYNENSSSTEYFDAQQEFEDALTNSSINQENSDELSTFTKIYLETNNYNTASKACAFKVVAVVAAAAVALAVVVWSVAAIVEGVVFWTSNYSFIEGNTLLKDQLINSISELTNYI